MGQLFCFGAVVAIVIVAATGLEYLSIVQSLNTSVILVRKTPQENWGVVDGRNLGNPYLELVCYRTAFTIVRCYFHDIISRITWSVVKYNCSVVWACNIVIESVNKASSKFKLNGKGQSISIRINKIISKGKNIRLPVRRDSDIRNSWT